MKSLLLPVLWIMTVASPCEAFSSRSFFLFQMHSVNDAIWSYHRKHGSFPSDILDSTGKPLLSWRVRILPSLDNIVYKKLRLNEPWDSPHNLPLAKEIPLSYLHPKFKSEEGHTYLAMPRGPGTWLGDRTRVAFADLQFDKRKTALLVELSEERGVIWTKPQDWTPDANDPFQGLATCHKESRFRAPGCFIACADGTTRVLSADTPRETLLGMLGPTDGAFPWTLSWWEALFESDWSVWLLPPLIYSIAVIAWAAMIVWRFYCGSMVSLGEWLCVIIAVQQAVYLFSFLRLYEIERAPPAFRDQHELAFWFFPRFSGFLASMRIACLVRSRQGWPTFFILLGLALLVVAADAYAPHQFRQPEESLFTMASPIVIAVAALVAASWNNPDPAGQGQRRWLHWLGIGVAILPLAWFWYCCGQGMAYSREVFVRVLF